MLISNGIVTRNIAEKQLPEYTAKGYKEVAIKSATSAPTKTAKKTGDK